MIASAEPGQRGQVIDSSQRTQQAPKTEAIISPKLKVRIQGTLVLPPEVYLQVIDLPPKSVPNERTAALVRKQVRSFLRRTGYELATVKAFVVDGGITVDVDEGQIERILFIGPLSYQLLRFKMSLVLPNDVFNRQHFTHQVEELSEALGVVGVRWELVRTAAVKHVGPQVVQSEADEDDPPGEWVIRARRPYEVRVYFPDDSLATTLGVDFRMDFLNGAQLGLINPSHGVFMPRDVLRMGARAGVGLRSKLDTGRVYPAFSRAVVGLAYDTAPIVKGVGAALALEADWMARQRGDLGLENYNAIVNAGALQLNWELSPGLRFLGGGGIEWRRFFGYEPAPGVVLAPDLTTYNRLRPFVTFSQEAVFNPWILRWARRHSLESEVRWYFRSREQPGMGIADLRYQYVKDFGWNDFWVRSRGRIAWGSVTFHDEVSAGEFLRALYGSMFVPTAANLQLEFRLSIARDLFKISVFHDVAALASLPRNNVVDVQWANAFGPGLHLLLFDMFQLDAYGAFGFRRGGELSAAFSLLVGQAF